MNGRENQAVFERPWPVRRLIRPDWPVAGIAACGEPAA